MGKVRLSESARTDLLEAWLFVAEENAAAADSMLDAIERECGTLLEHPLMGRARPELGKELRSWQTATPYVLFYLVHREDIAVVRVLHHARDVERIDF